VLNNEQKLAAHSIKPAIVTAGPGSGKTRTLIERVAYLLDNKISPTEILCFTFTRSAAKEMKERLADKFDITGLTVTTIHSFCLNLLRKHYHLIGLKEHILTYDDIDSDDLKTIIADENLWRYNKKKPETSPDIDKINREYYNRLREYNAVNFDQMQELAVKLLNTGKLKHIQNRYRYVLVDEMQDTSDVDYKLITKIAEIHKNVFGVGDIDQCIFEFRGSNPFLINKLEEFIDDGYRVELNRSYRCPQKVLDLCNKLSGTKLVSETDVDVDPILKTFDTHEEEAEWVVKMLNAYDSDNVGILCRTNRILGNMSDHLNSEGIEHNVVGHKVSALDDGAVRLMNSFLKLWYNNNDYLNLYRVMPVLFHNIPTREITRIKSKAVIEGKSMLKIAEASHNMSIFRLDEIAFLDTVRDKLREWHLSKGMTTKADNIIRYREYISSWLKENPGSDLEDFIFYISDLSVTEDSHNEVKENRISLLTIHAAKGLEFDTVFIPQMNKYSFRSNDRNTLFVAMSRTKRNLFMSY